MSVSGVCLAFRLCAQAPVVADGGVDSPRVSGIMAPKSEMCEIRAKAPRDDMDRQTPAHRHFFALPFNGGVGLPISFRVPQNIIMGPGVCGLGLWATTIEI